MILVKGMINMISKKNIAILFITVGLLGAILGLYINLSSYQTLSITHKNIDKIKVYNTNKPKEDPTTYNLQDTSIRILKGQYKVYYFGKTSYSSGVYDIKLSDKPVSIKLSPGYSEAKLNSILDSEKETITSTIKGEYKNINLYTISPGSLYDRGQWYATTLVYGGDDDFNADTLRIVLKKESGIWNIVTNPPSIIVSKNLYKNIPNEVIEDINTQRPPLDLRFQ
jgi:hypothetical protein